MYVCVGICAYIIYMYRNSLVGTVILLFAHLSFLL